jgi:SNF2 family DNA or RNA helicase
MMQKLSLVYLMTYEASPYKTYHVLPALIQKGQKPIYIRDLDQISDLSEQDQDIFKALFEQHFLIQGKEGADLLEKLIDSNRLHFASFRTSPLRKSVTQEGHLSWIAESQDKKRLHCRVMGGTRTVLPVIPLWYIDHHQQVCGEITTLLDPEIASILLFSAPLTDLQIQEIYSMMKKISSEKKRQEKLKTYLDKISAPIPEKNIDNWYVNWSPVSKHHSQWLDFEMGVELDGTQVNLLPALAELVRTQLSLHSIKSLANLPDDKVFILELPQHKKLEIPYARLKKILSILIELYQEDSLSGHGKLRVSPLRALQFSKLKEALDVKKINWHGENTPQKFIKKFELLKNKIQQNHDIFFNNPAGFRGKLRHYQQEGVLWLQFLKETQLSGILADDMGLGKTIQVLSHLLMEKQKSKSKKPSLIISPTSLIMNWAHEINQFAPTLKYLILYGQSRKKQYEHLEKYDVIITSYALLMRDETALAQFDYHLLILDEAQYIKNIHSKAGYVARTLVAEQRICLTGTPMENHLGELWTLFHFLLPGLLGDRKQFNALFRMPIEKEHDQERLTVLKQRISPFFLRRTKQEVLQELPEKIDMTRPLLLTPQQRELYENVRVILHQKVMATIEQQGLGRSQIFILDALLKLRQICCDPRLLKLHSGNYTDHDSAKLEFLMELLPELVLEGRKILLFSQFTQMLSLIEPVLKDLKIPFLKLTGKTRHRDEVIQQFQSGQAPVFLISLKAGGVGLNLTMADTVIHYDPWWNPQVENQATDRAHRIGQDKTVFVYKLITSGTIEEKMAALQQDKRSLFDATLSGNSSPVSSLSLNDIEKIFAPVSRES